MSSTIEKLDAEIARLQAEAASVERMPPTIADRYADVHAELSDAERLYQTHGLKVSAGHPAEAAQLQRQALIGLCMTVGADKILKVERQRIEAQGEGLGALDRARKLDDLRRAVLRTAAQRELELRKIEGDGEFQPRVVHPEPVLYRPGDLSRLAAR